MEKIFNKGFHFIWFVIAIISLFSCEDLVVDGIRVDYPESDALLEITAAPDTLGVLGDTINFTIKASANYDIRAFSVKPRYEGASGTGFSYPHIDPFIDHAFGTIQKNTREFEIIYHYVIPKDINQILIDFELTEEQGQRSEDQLIVVVDDVATYTAIELHSINNYQTDGFSTFNGEAYRNLKNYENVSIENRVVQQNLDLVFLADIDQNNSSLAAPAYGGFSSNMTIKNQTNLLLLEDISDEEFENLDPTNITEIVPLESIIEANSYVVENLKVGDYVGFVTDYNASNSYKAGILRVNSLHRSSCDWYEGTSFLLGFDLKVQVEGRWTN